MSTKKHENMTSNKTFLVKIKISDKFIAYINFFCRL